MYGSLSTMCRLCTAKRRNGKHGVDNDNATQDNREDVSGQRRSADDVPAERQRTHRRHPAVIVRRLLDDVVQPRAIHQSWPQHPVRRLRAGLQHRRQLRQNVPWAGEEGHARLERTFRQLHREGCHSSWRTIPYPLLTNDRELASDVFKFVKKFVWCSTLPDNGRAE